MSQTLSERPVTELLGERISVELSRSDWLVALAALGRLAQTERRTQRKAAFAQIHHAILEQVER